MTGSNLRKAFEIIEESIRGNRKAVADELRFASDVLGLYFANMECAGTTCFSEDVLLQTISETLDLADSQEGFLLDQEGSMQYAGASGSRSEEKGEDDYGPMNFRERRGSVCGTSVPLPHIPFYQKSAETEDTLLRILLGTKLIAQTMDLEQLRKFVGTMRSHEIEENEQLITEGESGNTVYLVESGAFEIIKRDRVKARVGKGNLFGEISVLYSIPRTATVRCTESAVVWSTSSDAYTSIIMADRRKIRMHVSGLMERVPRYARARIEEKDKILTDASLVHYKEGEAVEAEDARGMFLIIKEGCRVSVSGREVLLEDGDFVSGGFTAIHELGIVFFSGSQAEDLDLRSMERLLL